MAPNTRRRVIVLLLQGHGVRSTARKLKIHPSRAGKIATEAVTEGVLINTAPKGSPAHFVRGPNGHGDCLPPVDSTSAATTDPTVGVGGDEFDFAIIGGPISEGFIPMRVHSLGHRFDVIEGPTKEVPWTRTTTPSGVPNHVLELPMAAEDNRLIKIVYREGRTNKSLDVWTPEVIITNPDALNNFPEWAAGRAQRVANWLSRKFGFKFGIMEMCQDFHFAAALPPDIAQAAKELGLIAPDLWPDGSRGRGEMETATKVKAVEVMTLPGRMAAVESKNTSIEENMVRLADGQDRLATAMENLTKRLLKMLGPETSELPLSDPEGMFR